MYSLVKPVVCDFIVSHAKLLSQQRVFRTFLQDVPIDSIGDRYAGVS